MPSYSVRVSERSSNSIVFRLTMFRKVVIFRSVGSKFVSTNPSKRTTELITATRRDDYYKNLGVQNVDYKPTGWDEALPYERIPGPKPLPAIGNMWRFLPPLGEYYNMPLLTLYKKLREKYGDIIVLKGIIGRKPLVVVYNPDDIENCLRNAGPYPVRYTMESFVYYRTKLRKNVFQGVGGVLTVQGEDWFKFRSTVNPVLMQPKTVQQYVGSIDKVANELVENIKYFSTQDERNEMPENFLNEIYKFALESIGVIALDKHLGCLNLQQDKDSEPQKMVSHVLEMFELLYVLDVLPPIWKLFSTPSWKRYIKIMDFITQTNLKHIEETLQRAVDENTPEEQLSVVQRLAKQNRKIAVAMAMDMLMAGIDTTGKTLGAALYFLARNPDKQECLREEIIKSLPKKNSAVTKEILSESPYLKAVIKETTRIAPIAVGQLRTTVKDLVLRGYRIPRGSEVLSMSIINANSDEFKEPEKFIPERWLRTTDDDYSFKNAHTFAFLPFGFGARSCVGKRFANLELEVAIAKIVRNFKLSWPHEDMPFSGKFLYGVAAPLKLKVQALNE